MRVTPGRCLLRQLLKEKRMTQLWLCEQTGISQANMSAYVSGRKKMGVVTMKTLSTLLEVPMDDLYEWEVDDGHGE
ncbi:helix-turn-helix transcriptional regulator [Cohnella ginsengisoli]|uniref:Helix-turn-helix transcriptional regulator n=1 Tax=Cohnella ginsengisoli TaxID=425004 RepID=A0A9X4KHC0_9BACL|nr:helix-turn-helix transcriptional regulator [Cohnella ginsengisoli]MDG0791966.1 helix-turn-helix transcriptional regulator [Cohnella ginsengisoli]